MPAAEIARGRSLSTTTLRTIALWGVLALLVAGSPRAEIGPGLSLATFTGDPEITLDVGDPLLLYVIIDGEVSTTLTRLNEKNREMIDSLRRDEEFQSLSDKEKQQVLAAYQPHEIPEFRLGSAQTALEDLVEFRTVDARGNAVELTIRSLAVNDDLPSAQSLDPEQPLLLVYGLEPGFQATASPEELRVTAVLDTRDQAEMWQGVVESDTVTLGRHAGQAAPDREKANMKLYMAGTFYLADRQFEKAKMSAEQLVRQDPSFIGGWLHLGDALAGLGQDAEALEAFRKAMSLYYGQTPVEGRPQEHPEYTARRIREIQQKLESED
jgi:tetratricopeptide (TPR) repeat protein